MGARPEILRVLLADPDREFGLAELGALASMTKRNANEAVSSLEAAGVLAVNRLASTHRVRLLRGHQLVSLVGPVPTLHPDWGVLLRVTWGTLDTLERTSEQPREIQEAELRRLLRSLSGLLAHASGLGLPPPPGHDVRSVLVRLVEDLARDRPPDVASA